jgi:hypothetical protein
VANTVLGQQAVTIGERDVANGCRIARVPIQYEIALLHGGKRLRGLRPGCRVAGLLVLKQKDQVVFRHSAGGLAQVLADLRQVWFGVGDPFIIEATNAFGVEGAREMDALLQDFTLFVVAGDCTKLI